MNSLILGFGTHGGCLVTDATGSNTVNLFPRLGERGGSVGFGSVEAFTDGLWKWRS